MYYRIYFLRLFNDLLAKQIGDLEQSLHFKMYSSEEGLSIEQQVRWAEDEGMDVIACLWEDYEEVMRFEPDIPVYPVSEVSFDCSVILYLLKKHLHEKGLDHCRRVILCTRLQINVSIELLNEMFDLDILAPNWKDEPTPELLREYAEKGYQVVVCHPRYMEMVRESGMYPFHDNEASQYMNFYHNIKEIIQHVTLGSQLVNAASEMKNMLDHSFEAICVLDDRGRVTAYNEKAKEMFERTDGQAIEGTPFCRMVPAVPEEDLQEVLEKGKGFFGRLITTNQLIGMLNISPNISRRGRGGAVVHFTTVQQIETMESQVKSEFYQKGHYAKYHFSDIKGESEKLTRIKRLAERFSKYNAGILLYGESGCGKELFAQGIHNSSLRSNQPFVAINCGSLPSNLLESELFGYAEGAFTGAQKRGKKGLFEIANKGTIFLDEISEMCEQGQIRLLRVLEERSVMRVGDDKVIPIDVRVIAASNKKLLDLVKAGKFREDLYYRLNVLTLDIPPLRERGRDIILIADSFIERYCDAYKKRVVISPEAKELLLNYEWEGNVRQLRNFCERLAIVADDLTISPEEMQEQLDMTGMSAKAQRLPTLPVEAGGQEEAAGRLLDLSESEKQNIRVALEQANGNRVKAAALLGVSKTTLWRRMKALGLV